MRTSLYAFASDVADAGTASLLLEDVQARAGVDGVVVCGTNGEGTSLSVAERKRVRAVRRRREG